MTKINFKLSAIPSSDEKYRLISDTEGQLIILQDDRSVFSCDEVLLVEFARVLGGWLKYNEEEIVEDFVYNSMDFEEEPVIALRKNTESDLTLESALVTIPKYTFIKSDNFIRASKVFLQKLYEELVDKKISLEKYDSFYLPKSL